MKKLIIALFCMALLAGNAFAQLDPDDDGIGVYFDPCACVNCLTLEAGSHTGYLVITHPTSPDGVGGWEAKITVEGPAFVTNWDLLGNAINVATRPDEFIVGVSEPLYNPYSFPAVVVAILDILILNTDDPVNFYIDGIYFASHPSGQPAYLDGIDYDIIKPLQQATGGPDYPVATINGECAVAVTEETMDGIKALYR
jgi:hypothetical protein